MMSTSILDPLRNVIVYNRRRIRIDNAFFRLHYVSTCILLMASAVIVATKMSVGTPINCIAAQEIKDVVNEYCYIHSTFTRGRLQKGTWTYEPGFCKMLKSFNSSILTKENEIYPGVRPALISDRVTIHSYYQWVWVMLPLQAIGFYLPHWIWEKLEKGIMTMLVGELNLLMVSDETKVKQREKIVHFMKRNRGYHLQYAVSYAMAEILNLVNIVLQLVLTDYFLDNAFTTYGLNVFQLTVKQPYHRDDILARVFPTVTSCRLVTGGVAFGKVQHDILCILSINIINEKVYIVLWFWFLFVLICSVSCIVYRVATLFAPVRIFKMQRKLRRVEQRESAAYITKSCDYGEWFLIYRLSQNMDPVSFSELVEDIDRAFRKWDMADLLSKEGFGNVDPSSKPCSPFETTYFANDLDEDDKVKSRFTRTTNKNDV